MADQHQQTHIAIGDLSLRLSLVADALGIPAATLERLASGEWVAVPKEAKLVGCDFGAAPASTVAMRARWENGEIKYTEIPMEDFLAAATEAGSHDD